MNIIVITIDTLRYDYIGAHGHDWMKTPNLDRLAGQSWVFHHSYTSSYPTIPHRTDAFCGNSGAPFHPWVPLSWDYVTLPRVLAEAGYATQLIHDTPHLVNGGHNFDWPFHAWTPVRGAEVDRPWLTDNAEEPDNFTRDPLFDVIGDAPLPPAFYTYIRANRNRKTSEDWNCARLWLTASQWLRDNARRERFFLWVDCFDPHEPWDVPPEYMQMYDTTPGYDGRIDPRSFWLRNDPNLPAEARKRVAAQYAAKVSWVDTWFGKFLDTFEETGLAKNTAILLTSDHGTNVGERGAPGKPGGFGKGFPVREQEAHTPFMIRLPDGSTGRSEILVQPMDIFATVCGIAGVHVPEAANDSNDVLAIARSGKSGPRQVIVAGNPPLDWHNPQRKIIYTVIDGEWCLEYALKPENCIRLGSLDNVAADNQDVVDRLRSAGNAELTRRGTDRKIMGWLESEGTKAFPLDARPYDRYPPPAGYYSYFQRLYDGDRE